MKEYIVNVKVKIQANRDDDAWDNVQEMISMGQKLYARAYAERANGMLVVVEKPIEPK